LNEKCRKRIEYVWNAKYNNFVEPKKYKIPVALSCGKKWKKDSDFRPNEPQIQSVQFIKDAGSGLLAYGVGVGKTASAILNMSYAFDNNISKKALLVVPNPTYEKWKGEIAGMEITEFTVTYTENSEVLTKVFAQEKDADKFSKTKPKSKITSNKFKLKGILPNVNIVGLYNLNKDVVFGLKEYTEKEKLEIANAEDLLIYLSKIAKDYAFDDRTINAEIENRYGNFELSNVITSYNVYLASQTKAKKKAQPIFAWWKRSVTEYVNSLYYRLGKMKPVSDKTIFVTTFEGLSQLGVEELSIDQRVDINSNDSFFGKMYNELTQGDNLERLKYYGKSNAFADELEIMIYGGVGQNKIYLKELGIDYAIFDESHNFKKVFVTVKGKPKQNPPTYKDSGAIDREQKKYTMKMASSPSNRALSSYLVSRYVQIVNKNRGVIHLTATPFTNSPIEVYSMLALTNYEKLLKAGYKHIEDFFDSFMRIAYEIRFTASQTIQKDEVLVGYNNTPQLRTLIYSIMD
jgi:N12 class adenine-specific DNA methylase